MTSPKVSDVAAFMLDLRMMRAGAALTGVGLMTATAGASMMGLALSRAARQWFKQREVSPTTMAADRMRQARHASKAGAAAWRDYQMAAANNGVPRH